MDCPGSRDGVGTGGRTAVDLSWSFRRHRAPPHKRNSPGWKPGSDDVNVAPALFKRGVGRPSTQGGVHGGEITFRAPGEAQQTSEAPFFCGYVHPAGLQRSKEPARDRIGLRQANFGSLVVSGSLGYKTGSSLPTCSRAKSQGAKMLSKPQFSIAVLHGRSPSLLILRVHFCVRWSAFFSGICSSRAAAIHAPLFPEIGA